MGFLRRLLIKLGIKKAPKPAPLNLDSLFLDIPPPSRVFRDDPPPRLHRTPTAPPARTLHTYRNQTAPAPDWSPNVSTLRRFDEENSLAPWVAFSAAEPAPEPAAALLRSGGGGDFTGGGASASWDEPSPAPEPAPSPSYDSSSDSGSSSSD